MDGEDNGERLFGPGMPDENGGIPSVEVSDEVDLGRRDAMKGLAVAGAVVGLYGATIPEVRTAAKDVLLGPSADHGEGGGGHGEHGEDSAEEAPKVESEHHGVSRINVITAVPVVGEFFNAVRKNMKKGEGHEEFGLNSFKRVGTAEGVRLGILGFTDWAQFKHESTDIAISDSLMTVLTTAAEVTDHLDADEEAIFNDDINTLIDKMDDDPQVKIEMPGPDATLEQWEEFKVFKDNAVVQTDAQNVALGTLGLVSPFVSATLGDAMNMRMMVQLTERQHAKEMIKLKHSEAADRDISEQEEQQAMENAVNVSNVQMNGKFGYVNKTLTFLANLQAAGATGDAPVWFFLLRNKAKEWFGASVEGLAKANATALIASQAWLTKTVGIDAAKKALPEIFKATIDTWQATADFKKVKDQSRKRNEKVAEQFGDAITTARDAGELSLGESRRLKDVHHQLADGLAEMPRSRFVFRGEDFKRVRGEAVDNNRLKLRNIGRYLTGRELISDVRQEAHGVDVEDIDEMSEKLRNAQDPSGLFDAILGDKVKEKDTQVVDGMKDMLTVLVKLKQNGGDMDSLSEEDQSILDRDTLEEFGLRFDENSEGFIRGDEDLEAEISEIRELYLDGDPDAYEKLEELMNSRLTTSNEHIKAAIRETWANMIKADTEPDEDEAHKGFGEASTEVFNALRTQILAANALSSLIKGGLEKLGDAASIQDKTALVLAFSGFISAVADNVVAYLFAEDVLSDLYEGELGEEVFNSAEAQHLVTRIKRAALFVAIIFGSMSKIGNGPNFKMNNIVASVGEDGFEYDREKLDLTDSFKNGVAWTVSMAGLADNVHSVNKAMSELQALLADA